MAAHDDAPMSEDNTGFRFAVLFFGLLILAAILFTLYVLLWDGGAHT